MKVKRWFAVLGMVIFAIGVALVNMAFNGPRLEQPAGPAAAGALGVGLTDFASGFTEPLAMAVTGIPSDTRLFAVERAGIIRIIQANGTVLPTPFLDISSRVESKAYQEMGLLGLAFEPDYATTGRFYVYYTSRLDAHNANAGDVLNVARYQVSANPNLADPAETKVLTIAHPNNLNHNGGQLQFGPDGDLYLGPGDGGGGGDQPNNAQHTDRLLGKVLRLNVTGVPTYTIPSSNPFAQMVGARPEIWAYGLRNPWRFSFDRATGELYIGDVGQDAYEEVDYQPPDAGGRNYGWHCYEGFHPFTPGDCPGAANLIPPVAEYAHNPQGGEAIMGGYVYRGARYPALAGLYFYADYVSGNFWAMTTCSWHVTALGHLLDNPSTFAQDAAGELYVASLSNGHVYKLTGPTARARPARPAGGNPLYLPVITRGGACGQ